MRCTATTSTGTQCRRPGRSSGPPPQRPLCHDHKRLATCHTCIHFLPDERRYCRSVVAPSELRCRFHATPGGDIHSVPWGSLPSIVWANVAKWLSCKARRILRRVSQAFVIRYRFHQCSCLRSDGPVVRRLSHARFAFWNHLFDCVLLYTHPPRLPDAWADDDDPHLRHLTSHYATWVRRLQRSHDAWMRLVRSFRHAHSMYDGDVPHAVLFSHAFPHDEFEVVEDGETVRIHNRQSASLAPTQRFHTESGALVPTIALITRLYDGLLSEWGVARDAPWSSNTNTTAT
jgi:hypothetical protein